jgi:hypothetical protein
VRPWSGAAILLRKPERRQAAAKYAMPVIESLGQAIGAAMGQEQRGLAGLHEVILPAPAAPTPKQQVAIVLARQGEPLLAREVRELIEEYFPAGTVPMNSLGRRPQIERLAVAARAATRRRPSSSSALAAVDTATGGPHVANHPLTADSHVRCDCLATGHALR